MKDHLLSLAGVYQPREKIEESAVPLALTQYLRDHPEIKTIILRLDNDRAGRLAAKALMAVRQRTIPLTHDSAQGQGLQRLPVDVPGYSHHPK